MLDTTCESSQKSHEVLNLNLAGKHNNMSFSHLKQLH